MSKTFAQAPKPKQLTAETISAFERGGAGQDTQTHIRTKVGSMGSTKADKPESMKRLSIDLPKSLHRRFKTACSNADKKMLAEVTDFINRRTSELEKKN